MITKLLNSTLSHSQTIKLYKASIAVEDRKRRALEKKGVESLYSMFRQIQNEYRINPNLSASQNVSILNDLFYAAMVSMQPYLTDVALSGSSFGRQQVIDISNRRSTYQVKNTAEFEIEVNWAQADDDVLQWLNTGSDYTSSHFDMVTRTLSYSNEYWLRNDYRRYINGEIDLDTTLNRLTENLLSRRRAELIIRTNVTDIFAQGQQEAYRASGTTRNQWYTRFDQRVCPICAPLHGTVAPIGGEFGGTRHTRPSAHMGCRCFLSPVALNRQEVESYFANRGMGQSMSINIGNLNPFRKKPSGIADDNSTYGQTRKQVKEFLISNGQVFSKRVDEIKKAEDEYRTVHSSMMVKLDEYRKNGDMQGRNKLLRELDDYEPYLDRIQKDKEKLQQEIIESNLSRLGQTKHQNIQIDSSKDLESSTDIEKGFKAFNRLVSDRYNLDHSVPIKSAQYGNRSYYLDGSLWLGGDTDPVTVVHELGHYLEDKDKKVQEAVYNFYKRRTDKEDFVTMESLFPGRGYRPTEKTKVDNFINPYMGLWYGGKGRGSELLSMGLEFMYKDPLKFLQEDEEHFNLIYDIMTGKVLD